MEAGVISFFPIDFSFKDGVLLFNYFHDIHFTRKEIEGCEYINSKSTEKSLYFDSTGLRGEIGWWFSIIEVEGILIIVSGGNC